MQTAEAPTANPTRTKAEVLRSRGEYGKLGGRPSQAGLMRSIKDEAQAFESIKEKWNYISHKLADEASKAARNTKKFDGRSLVALTTAAGIAYDKRWAKQTDNSTEVDIPPSLAAQIGKKLLDAPAKPAESKEVALLSQERDRAVLGPIDPSLLAPGL